MKLNKSLFFSRTHDFLEVYIPKQKDGSEHTKNGYRDALSCFRKYLLEHLHIGIRSFRFSDCTYNVLLTFRNWMIDEKGYKPRTVNQRMAAIRAYVHYAASEDVSLQQIDFALSAVPFIRVPKIIQPVIESTDTLYALLNSPKNTHLGRRDMMLMTLLFDTAVRVSELVNLQVNDVVTESDVPHIIVTGKGNKQRMVGLCDKTVLLIQSYLAEFHKDRNPHDYFFYTEIHGSRNRMSVRNVQRILKKYGDELRDTGVDIPDNVHPHMLRRSRATNWYRSGISVFMIAEALGHSTAQTTVDHYAISSLEQKRRIMDKNQEALADVKQEWPDDEDELAELCGLR